MHIFIDKFGGIVPRQEAHSLDITQATIAHDVRLRRNRLEAWREPAVVFDHAVGRSFYVRGCCLIMSSNITSIADVSPDWERFFLTGEHAYPEILVMDGDCSVSRYRLGLPQPTTPLSASGYTHCSRASDARAYTYTYVNAWGEESAPAMSSNVLTVENNEPVLLTGFSVPSGAYNIRAINIYRATTGMREPNAKQQEFNTTFLWIAQVPADTYEYTDHRSITSVGPVLETEKVHAPPDCLQNIVAIDDTVRLAGSDKNRIYFTEPFQTHNWPVKYTLTLDYEVVHMGAGFGHIFVTTDSYPYVLTAPDCEGKQCVPVQRGNAPLPDIGCYYPHSAIVTPYGFIYASPVGLILLSPDTSYTILTSQWFSPEDWMDIHPQTIRLGVYQTYIFIITDRVSFVLNLDRQTYGDLVGCELSTISDRPIDLVTSGTGDLLMLQNEQVVAWDKGRTYRPFFWESRELVGQDGIRSSITLGPGRQNDARGVAWSPASAKIHSDRTKFSLITPLQDPAYVRHVSGEDWFRLPRVGRNLWYKMRFQGTKPVDFAAMGTSNFTLNQGK